MVNVWISLVFKGLFLVYSLLYFPRFTTSTKECGGKPMRLELENRSTSISGVGESQSPGSHSIMPSPSTSSPLFVSRLIPRGKPSIQSIVKTKEKEEADKIVARCFLWRDIPFNIAKNNPKWKK
jgi:hypothetical protein